MSDDQEFEQMKEQLRALVGSMGRFTNAVDGASKAAGRSRKADEQQLKDEMKRGKSYRDRLNDSETSARNAGDAMSVMAGRTDVAADRMQEFARKIPGGAALVMIAAWGKNTVDTWRQLNDVGQSFNGSIFSLAKSATEAGLPLGEFAESIRKNSKTVAVYGSKSVMGLMKSVRQQTEANGLYGYTMDGLNQVTGEYLENQRLYGNKSAATNKKSIASSIEFAKQVTAVAGATGKSREEIIAATTGAMRDVAMITRMIGMSSINVQSFSDSTMKAATILGGMPGMAGETFATFLTQSVGYGTALFGDATSTFIDGGLGQMVGSMDSLANTITNGGGDIESATWTYLEDFKSQVKANRQSLQVQAMSGNESSKRILQMYSEVENITQAQYEAKKKEAAETASLTALIASGGNILKRLLTGLVTGMFGKLADIEGSMTKLVDSDAFKKMEARFTEWGSTIGTMLSKIDEDDVTAFANGIEHAANAIFGLVGILAKVGRFLTQIVSVFQNVLGGTAGTVVGIGAIIAIPAMIKGLGGFLMRMVTGSRRGAMNVMADRVYVNGGGMMGGGRGGRMGARAAARGGRFGSRYGTGSTASRMAARAAQRSSRGIAGGLMRGAGVAAGGGALMHGTALARATGNGGRAAGGLFGRMGGRALGKLGGKEVGKVAAKGLGKSLLKKIPGISILAGLGFGAQRALGGDFLGAGGELLSGVLGTVPGLGTAASLGIDGMLAARDMGAMGGVGGASGRGGVATPRRRGPNWGMLGLGAVGAAGAGGLAGMALSGGLGRRNNDEQIQAIEARMNESRSAQTDARAAIQDRQAAEMKALYEAGVALNRDILNNIKRLVQIESQGLASQL